MTRTKQDPDSSLVVAAQKGDQRSFAKLVEKYFDMVYAAAFGICANREESLDTAQDVFLKIYHQIRDFKGDSKFKTWLYRVAVNASIDLVRKRRSTVPLEETEWLQSPERGPRDLASVHEMQDLMKKALRQLNEEHRAVLVLREWNGLSYEEIAEVLKIEMGTVMSRLHYARKKLAEILEPIVIG